MAHTDSESGTTPDEQTQVWMVERTFSTDAPNIMVITYATRDGSQYLTLERAYNRAIRHGSPTITAARTVPAEELAPTRDEEVRERYATEAQRMQERHEPDEAV